jgi:rhodanese-related sulfurtransferase/DNA-binding transcriptional ArsR family regulator
MSRQNFKKQLFEQFARVGKALANGHRLELLEFLAQGERTVEALAEVSGLTVANTSQHLQQLRRVGLVAAHRDGLHVRYRLADPTVSELLGAMEKIAERQLADVERLVRSYLTTKDSLEPVSRADLLRRVAEDDVIVLDVRPPEEYRAGHVPGALNVPVRELEAQLGQLPRELEVVAYCRGPYCVLAFEAVARLRARGFSARRLEDGFPEWKSAGLPVEQDAAGTDAKQALAANAAVPRTGTGD